MLCVDMCVDMCVDVDVAVYTAVSLSKPDTASQLGYSVRTFSDHTKVCTCSVVCVVIGSDVWNGDVVMWNVAKVGDKSIFTLT